MKGNFSNSSMENSIWDVLINGIERYKINQKDPSEIPDAQVEELFELAMLYIGDSNRKTMVLLNKEKKVQTIKQITVIEN